MSRWLLVIGLACGCSGRTDVPLPLHTSERPSTETAAAGERDDGLWFSQGLGREVIEARQRQEYDRAVALLDRLLAQPDLSVGERGAAQWLRGLEDVRLRNFAAAADRFAQARKTPALAPVDLRLRALEAQARLDSGDPASALALVGSVPMNDRERSAVGGDLLLIEADARARTGDEPGAIKGYERYLRRKTADRRFEARVKLARLLVASADGVHRARALELYETLLLEVPLSDYGEEAAEIVPKLRAELGQRPPGRRSAFQFDVALARIEALIDHRNYELAQTDADALMKRRRLPQAVRCRALYLKGTALFKQRERARAAPVFDQAARACAKAGADALDHQVRARYQAARGRYAKGEYVAAAAAFEALARDHSHHSYADDAWVLAGEAWESAGELAKAKGVLDKALAQNGDMRHEAIRRLLLQSFSSGKPDEALALVDAELGRHGHSIEMAAKLHYYRGRALALSGRADQAREAWMEVLRREPLGYWALQSLSRLREHDPTALEAALGIIEMGTEANEGVFAGSEADPALLILARLGLGEALEQELEVADVSGWPAVEILNRAGFYAAAQRVVAKLGPAWRSEPPRGPAQTRWMLAHPRAFASVVDHGERTHDVPALLTFAIMQTESRFDPGAISWAGARGLVQLMPATARDVARRAGIALDDGSLLEPTTNLDLGIRYLAGLVARFKGGAAGAALAVPSYNAGAGSVSRWLTERSGWPLDLFLEAIPYDETRKYAQRVLGRWFVYRWLYAGDLDPGLGVDDRVPYLPLQLPS